MTASSSVRVRILVGAVLLLGGIMALSAALSYRFASRAADEAFDRVLGAAALSIADAVQVEEGSVTVDVPYAALAILGTSRLNRVFYRVASPSGAILTGYQDLGHDGPVARGADPTFRTTTYRGSDVRLAVAGRYVSAQGLEGFATVAVAETLEARSALAARIFRNAFLANVGVGVLALLLVWAGLRWAFAPFRMLEAELRDRVPTDLTPIRTSLPREVSPLLGALDGFMGRLSATLDRLRGLAADAAHQIRTPLASVRAQAELALAEVDPNAMRARMRRVHANAVAATQIVNQILADATIAHRLETQSQERVDLLDLVDAVQLRLEDGEASRVVVDTSDLGPDADPLVLGDAFALREMLQNLVDNALRYTGGPVEIALAAGPGGPSLSVSDRGPGIPDEEKPLVVERFRRGSAAGRATGSGLGLSIAKAAAEASGGRLELRDRAGGGLTVSVAWPPPSARAPVERGHRPARMLAGLVALMLLLPSTGPAEARTETWPATLGSGTTTLRIAADGEVPTLRRLIKAFQRRYPATTVELTELSAGLVHRVVATAGASGSGPDLAVSAAVDRQVALVNDGHAQAHRSGATARLPEWAKWRDELFGATFEPVVFAYDPRAFSDDEPPTTRLRLAQLLESQSRRFRGRVITYHVGLNGMGYVFATFDSLTAPVFWRLARAMGDVDVQLAADPTEILNAMYRGEASVAYNLAASATVTEGAAARGLVLVEPEDYKLVVLRTLLIPRAAREPAAARAFVDFVLSDDGQRVIGASALLNGQRRRGLDDGEAGARAHVIPLGPASLIFLDERKRNRFLDTWFQLMLKP